MLRTQIRFTEEQHRLLRAVAQREGVSIAEVVRRCVVRFFHDERQPRKALYDRAAALVGTFEDPQGATDLSEHHDAYLDETYS